MKQTIILTIAAAAALFAATGTQTFTGTITDNMCGKAGHSGMKMGSDAKCVAECVKGMHGKYVLSDGKNLYELSDQKAPARFAAKKVTVTGTLDGQTIKVAKIEAAR